jgi:Co/Zn/Cd efflux system component
LEEKRSTINASMFLLEAAIGWFAQSTALLADSLDMLADAAVFAIALVAVGRSARFKA